METLKIFEIHHYSNRLFSFKTSRPKSFKFKNGEFAMLGIEHDMNSIYRAYSMVSTNFDDHLEFLSIKAENGEFTSALKNFKPGDTLIIKPKTTGSLVVDYLYPKENLILLCTGTGIAPFMSVVFDPFTYERFKNVYLFHTVRSKKELCYKNRLDALSQNMPLKYVDSVSQEKYIRRGRFWNFLNDYFPNDLNPKNDAIMICGSPELNKKCRTKFHNEGWHEGNTGDMGDFLLERAFVDK